MSENAEQNPLLLRWLTAALIAIALFTFIKNFWINEDAYILYRSLDQLLAGRGPVWNSGERVQVYTSVAWYWLLAALQWLIGNILIANAALSALLFASVLFTAWRLFRASFALIFLLCCWLLSKSWFDYTSSGLENVLGYAVVIAWYGVYTRGAATAVITQWQLAALTALLPLVRHDLLLLFLPALLGLVYQLRADRHALMRLAAAALPLLAWTVFSLIYYGMPLPNTAYAKLSHDFPAQTIWQTGCQYLYAHIAADPITVLVCVAALLIPAKLIAVKSAARLLGAGILLQMIYVAYAGGDYMLGRFVNFAFLLASLLLADAIRSRPCAAPLRIAFGAAVPIYLLSVANAPVITPLNYGHDLSQRQLIDDGLRTGALDARAFYYPASLGAWASGTFLDSGLLGHFCTDGKALHKNGRQVIVRQAVGCTGYYAGIEPHLVDPYALTDPFLARLPAIRRFVTGHYEREVVPGYLERLRDGHSALLDPQLNAFYEQIELISRSDKLFTLPRLRAIVALNDGASAKLLADYRNRTIAARAHEEKAP
jgi:arabinofuranosyltransferase